MSNHAFWEPPNDLDDLVPNFPPDFDERLIAEPPEPHPCRLCGVDLNNPNADCPLPNDEECPQERQPYEPPVSDFDTRPVVVTARDLWPEHRRSPSGNVIRLEAEEAWSPGVENGE